jgi:hypothetical protein
MVRIAFWVGFLYSAIEFYNNHRGPYKFAVALYGFIFFLAMVVPRVRLWGKVVATKEGQTLEGVMVELTHPELPGIVIAKADVDEDGKFFLRANKGTYNVNVKRKKETGGMDTLLTSKVKVGGAGVVNGDLNIK